MKQQFLRAPLLIRVAAIAIAAYPIAISVYSFRLLTHPKNPNAWFVLGVLEATYLLPAFGVLYGSQIARWFCLAWVTVSISRGAFSLPALSSQQHVFVFTCWIIQAVVVSLLFTPSSSLFFRKNKPHDEIKG